MRTRLALGTLAAWALAAGTSLAVAPQAGDPFPVFEGRDFVNTPAVDARNLRGRLVLCEIFSTT